MSFNSETRQLDFESVEFPELTLVVKFTYLVTHYKMSDHVHDTEDSLTF